MTPSTHQHGTDYKEYDSQADRICATWEDKALRRLHPQGADVAAEYAAAAKRHGCSDSVIRHFERIQTEQEP